MAAVAADTVVAALASGIAVGTVAGIAVVLQPIDSLLSSLRDLRRMMTLHHLQPLLPFRLAKLAMLHYAYSWLYRQQSW